MGGAALASSARYDPAPIARRHAARSSACWMTGRRRSPAALGVRASAGRTLGAFLSAGDLTGAAVRKAARRRQRAA